MDDLVHEMRSSAGGVQVRGFHPIYEIPLKTWLLYAYAVVSPFFVFSIVFTRDTASLWVVVAMGVLVALEFVENGGTFWFDRSFIYLGLLLAAYLLLTVILLNDEARMTVLGRTPSDRAATTTLRMALVALSFVLFTNLLADVPMSVLGTILKVQLFTGGAIAAFGILQYLFFTIFGSSALAGIEPTNESFGIRSFILRVSGKKYFRSTSIFHEPSYFGFFLIPLFVKAISAWFQHWIVGSRAVHFALLTIFAAAILTSFAFTALLSIFLLAGAFVILMLRRRPRVAAGLLVAAGAFLLIVVASPFGEAAVERFLNVFQLRDLSTLDRLLRVYSGLLVFFDHPLLGVGPGGYAFWYIRMGGIDRTILASPLNVWLAILTDVGLLGFIPFICFLGSILRRAVRALKTGPLVTVYLWSVIAYLILLTTLDVWFLDIFWFELAILLALSGRGSIRSPQQLRGEGRG